MTEEIRRDPGPDEAEGPGEAEGRQEARPIRDTGRTAAIAGMAGLVVAGLALIAKGPRTPNERSTPAVLTNAAVRADAGVAEALDASVTAPVVVRDADAGPRFVPAFRVKSLVSEGVEIVEGVYGKRAFAAALGQAGLSKAELKRLSRAFDGVHRIEHPGPKDAFVVAKDKAKGTIVGFEHIDGPSSIWQARVDEGAVDKRLIAKRLELFVEHKRGASALAVSADLVKAVAAAGLREGALEAIDEALDGHVDLATVRPGVRLRVVADELWVEGAFARFHVEALELLPTSGAALRIYYYERDLASDLPRRRAPNPGYYDAKAQQPYKGAFRSPLPLARVTSRFNPRRMHPVLKVVMPHNGVDFGAGTGTPVYASAAGTISTAGDGGPCGNMIQIEHDKRLSTAYCHLSRFAPGIHAGLHVEARQLVGYVGQSGRATGSHLHFAVKRRGVFIDPLGLKMDGVRVLPPADREIFGKRRAELDAALEAIALPSASADEPDDKDEPAGEE